MSDDEGNEEKLKSNINLQDKSEIQIFHGGNGSMLIDAGLVVLESKVNLAGVRLSNDKAESRFSYGLSADISEAIEHSIEFLILKGHLSIDTDYWIEDEVLHLIDLFNLEPTKDSIHCKLKLAVEEKSAIVAEFRDEIEVRDPLTDGVVIFSELERLLCDDGLLLTDEWYTTRILREYCCDLARRNLFLIGILWEQLRVKIGFGEQFEKQEMNRERLKNLSPLATEALVEKSNKWKQHALSEARKILKQQPWMYGNWSELANTILDEVESTNANSELRGFYRGKASKLKPKGSDLIGTETVSKFLSNKLKR